MDTSSSPHLLFPSSQPSPSPYYVALLRQPGPSYVPPVPLPLSPRRFAFGAVKRLLLPATTEEQPETAVELLKTLATSSPPSEKSPMSRSRDRIMANLDDMYREAFEAAKRSDDDSQMRTLDFAYRREQLFFEVLLDIRDAMQQRS